MLVTKLSVKLLIYSTEVPTTESSVIEFMTELFLKVSEIRSDVKFLATFSKTEVSEVKFAVKVIFEARS